MFPWRTLSRLIASLISIAHTWTAKQTFGQIKVTTGAGANKVLKSDANGDLTYATVPSLETDPTFDHTGAVEGSVYRRNAAGKLVPIAGVTANEAGAVTMPNTRLYPAIHIADLPAPGVEGTTYLVDDAVDQSDCSVGGGSVTTEVVYLNGQYQAKTPASTELDDSGAASYVGTDGANSPVLITPASSDDFDAGTDTIKPITSAGFTGSRKADLYADLISRFFAWAGFSTNALGVQQSPAGSWLPYNSNLDRTYCRKWVADQNGIATHVNVRFGATVATGANGCWVVLYNGTTLVGKSVVTPAANSWSGELALTAEAGQTLAFSTSDNLYFGISFDGSGGTDMVLSRDAGEAVKGWFATDAVGAAPPATVTWSEASTAAGLACILRFNKE